MKPIPDLPEKVVRYAAPPNESGECWCGCGGITPIAKETRTQPGHFKGHHIPYMPRHERVHRALLAAHEEDKPGITGTCLISDRVVNPRGYVIVRDWRGKGTTIQRVLYERLHGRRPDESERIITSCGDKLCIAPEHLEVITQKEVARRTRRVYHETVVDVKSALKAAPRIDHGILARKYGLTVPQVDAIAEGRPLKDSRYR